jgi:hydrogenase maturation factor HypF (carbamoyltransferase family)
MGKVYILDWEGCLEQTDEAPGVVIARIRDHWNEEPTKPQTFVILDDQGHAVAVLSRDPADPETCVTCYPNIHQTEAHRCRYVFANGSYVRTDVTGMPIMR